MNVVSYIVERFAEISTILLSMFFLYRTLDPKVNTMKQIVTGAIFLCVRLFYFYMNFGYNQYFSLVLGIVYAHLIFDGKLRTHIFWNLISIVIDGVVDGSVIGIYLLIPGATMAQVDLPGIDHIVIVLAAKVILFLIYYLITLNVDKNDLIHGWDSIYLLLIPIGCWIMLELQFKYGDELSTSISQPLLATGSLTLLLIVASVVVSFNWLSTHFREMARTKIQLRMEESTHEHITQINELYAQLSAIRHDLHNHFSAIGGYLEARDYGNLEEYIKKLTDVDLTTYAYVKHPVLNALVGAKVAIAETEGIQFSTDMVLPEKLPINDVDLCILISNILDNAFEAGKNAFEPRFIHLSTRVVNNCWVVTCRNATRIKGKFRSSGSLKSTKNSTGVHGIGTREMRAIAESTGGFVTYRHIDFEFCTLVTLCLSEE